MESPRGGPDVQGESGGKMFPEIEPCEKKMRVANVPVVAASKSSQDEREDGTETPTSLGGGDGGSDRPGLHRTIAYTVVATSARGCLGAIFALVSRRLQSCSCWDVDGSYLRSTSPDFGRTFVTSFALDDWSTSRRLHLTVDS